MTTRIHRSCKQRDHRAASPPNKSGINFNVAPESEAYKPDVFFEAPCCITTTTTSKHIDFLGKHNIHIFHQFFGGTTSLRIDYFLNMRYFNNTQQKHYTCGLDKQCPLILL